MRVLLTRPRADSEALAERLAARGIEALIEPLLTIEPTLPKALDLVGVQAFLVTSANGARALVGLPDIDCARPVFAVGDASAGVARAAGFTRVTSADGDVEELARLVRGHLQPTDGALLHAAGADVAGDLAGALGSAGFTVRRAVLYRAKPADSLSTSTRQAIASGAIDTVALFSPRTAAIFVKLAKRALADSCASMTALCLSTAVADALNTMAFGRVLVAERPTQDALLSLLDELITSTSEAKL